MVLCVKTSIGIGMQLALIAALGGRAQFFEISRPQHVPKVF